MRDHLVPVANRRVLNLTGPWELILGELLPPKEGGYGVDYPTEEREHRIAGRPAICTAGSNCGMLVG